MGGSTDVGRTPFVKHGVCHECGKRTQLWLPAKVCDKCLIKLAQQTGLLDQES